MSEDKKPDNMSLWNQVCETNPEDTKPFKGKGGFKGTAIAAQTQRKRATKLWGPFGDKWGINNEVFELLHLSEDPHDAIMIYTGKLYYPQGEFGIHSDIDVWMYVKSYKAWVKNNDIRKKVRTDAFTKGLSELGFNADVFMGLFDDSMYIAAMKEKHTGKITEEQVQEIFRLQSECKIEPEDFENRLKHKYKTDDIDNLNSSQAKELTAALEIILKKKAA